MSDQKTAVEIRASDGSTTPGEMSLQIWSDTERRSRALKKTLKIYGIILGVGACGLLIPLVHFVVAPLLVLTLLTSVPAYMKFMGDRATFTEVHGACTHCKKSSALRPFVNARLEDEVTVQCADCGQTSKVRIANLNALLA